MWFQHCFMKNKVLYIRRKFFVEQLRKNINIFFIKQNISLKLAESIGLTNSLYTGDTRYDRVKQNVKNFTEVPFIQDFIQDKPVLVIGSSWEAEENLVEKFINENSDTKIILALMILNVFHRLNSVLEIWLFCIANLDNSQSSVVNHQLLIIDNIGMLSRLYHYADVAVVGGGFHTSGLHNILEAAGLRCTSNFGNRYKKNPEADALIDAGAAKAFPTKMMLLHFFINCSGTK